jgi:hypothetical protein
MVLDGDATLWTILAQMFLEGFRECVSSGVVADRPEIIIWSLSRESYCPQGA